MDNSISDADRAAIGAELRAGRKIQAIKLYRELTGVGSCRRRAHETFLKTPTTRPSNSASVVRIGSIASFSGWSRTWSASRK